MYGRAVALARSLFERAGGFASVSRVVMTFYDKMLESPITRPFFANTDMKRLIDHQTKFVATLMGGPASYTNDHLERVHRDLGITAEAFAEAMDLIEETLEDHDFDSHDIQAVADEMAARKNFIVSKA